MECMYVELIWDDYYGNFREPKKCIQIAKGTFKGTSLCAKHMIVLATINTPSKDSIEAKYL